MIEFVSKWKKLIYNLYWDDFSFLPWFVISFYQLIYLKITISNVLMSNQYESLRKFLFVKSWSNAIFITSGNIILFEYISYALKTYLSDLGWRLSILNHVTKLYAMQKPCNYKGNIPAVLEAFWNAFFTIWSDWFGRVKEAVHNNKVKTSTTTTFRRTLKVFFHSNGEGWIVRKWGRGQK